MIPANELRIGNWAYGVMYPNQPLQIKTIHENIVHLGEHINGYDSLEPIPLTPEILEKCGFEKNHDDYYADALMLKPKGNVWEVWLYPVPKPQSLYNATNIIFLHQLQNLYFALTGKELTFNP